MTHPPLFPSLSSGHAAAAAAAPFGGLFASFVGTNVIYSDVN